jgi:pilus assembly protein CpaF
MQRTGVLDGSAVVKLLDAEVREEVRRSGVDPLVDADPVRRFAQSAVAGHDQRSLSGVVRPVDDPDAVVEELVARVAGFGPLQRYLDDPKVATGI